MRKSAVLCVLLIAALLVAPGIRPATAAVNTIAVDAAKLRGFVRPTLAGQMFEWALPEMNGAWAEKLAERSFESESVNARRSTLYDAFTGTSLDRSLWTPISLDAAPLGTIGVSGSLVTLTAAQGGRFGIMSNAVTGSRYAGYSVETKITSYTGMNALLNIYGGTGAGDFTHYAEFGIEGGVLKVFADGQPIWTGGAATLPATLRVDVSPQSNGARDLNFYYNGTLVRSMAGFTLLPDPFRVFLYGFSGSVSYDYLNIQADDTYDGFYGTALSPRWTPTALAGSNGTTSVSGGLLTVNGALNSRFGVMSDYIRNSAVDWTTIDVRLSSVTGTNGLVSIYGGTGTGDFTRFIEFGIEGSRAKVFTSDGTGNYSGTTNYTLPVTLTIKVSPYYANGRRFKFYVNGAQVHELAERRDVPAADFRLFLYGWSTAVTRWDYVNVSQRHMWDAFAPHFEGGPGLSVEWTPSTLAGNWGSASQSYSQLVINGAANSRYGVMSTYLDESDIYGYTVEAKLDSYTGTNALLNIYAGSGRGDFTKFVEFGIEGGVLKVFGDGVTTWTGPAAVTPAVLRVEAGPWNGTGRNFYFFYNGRLVHQLENATVIPNQEYRVFLYGFGTSVTRWDYLTWWQQPAWAEDGHSGVAAYSQDRTAYNGTYSQRIDVTQLTSGGRKGISQRAIAVTAGRQYRVDLYLKQSGLTQPVTVYLGPATGDRPSYSPYASADITGVGTGWAKHTVTLTPSTTDQQAKLFVGANGTGTLWVDMASVMPLDPAEAVYGGWRKEFVDRVVALNPVAIRWPGGIIADWYHWQNGVGARDSRAPQYYAQWDAQWQTNDVGTDEVLNLASNLGLTAILNVNWGTGTSAEAANWVEYTNGSTGTPYGAQRSANGYPAPWNVKYWEIGNETWGWWTPGWTSSASTFANSFNSFRDAMIAKDATLEFFGEGGDGNSTDQSWNQTLVTTSGSRLDHLAVHYYPPQTLPQNYNSANVYLASVGAPATVADRLTATQNTIVNNSREDIKAAVMEYNAMYFNEETRRTRSLEAALQTAGQLNLFARRPDLIEVNAYSTLAGFWDGGSIRLGNRGTFVTPSYEALRLFSNYHGPVLVQATTTSTTYNAPAMGNLPAKNGVPYLDATATRSANGTKLYLSVVNRDPSVAQAATISLANAGTIGATATAYTLNSASYLDKNSWQNPTRVATTTTTVPGVSSSFSYTFPAHSYTVLVFDTTAAAVNTASVMGRVVLASTGAPVAGATVQVVGGSSATTNADGYYIIPVATAGTYTLTVSKTGYTTVSLYHVEVYSDGTTAQLVKL